MSGITEIIINLIDNVSAELESIASTAESSFNSVENAAESAGTGFDSLEGASRTASEAMDNFNTQSLDEITTSAEDAGISLEQVQEAAAAAGAGIGSIDPSTLEETAKKSGDASNGMDGASESATLLEGAMGAVAAVGIVTFLEDAAASAGNMGDSFTRAAINLGFGADGVEQFKNTYDPAMDQVRDATDRGLGDTVRMFDSLGLAGLDNADIISQSSQVISGAAFNTGNSIDQVTNAYKMSVMTGNLSMRTTKALGVSMETLAAANGMSTEEFKKNFEAADENTRAIMINKGMVDKAAEGNKGYKGSWQGLSDAFGRAIDSISRLAGDFILPILIPAMETATMIVGMLVGAMRSLPGPVQTIIGVFILAAGGVATLIGGWTALSAVVNASKVPFLINTLTIVENTAAKWLSVAASAAYGVVTGILAGEIGLATIATGLATAAQWLLNAAMDANPIGIIVIAIVALIAVLGYLYYNNETVRVAIDALWKGIQDLANWIWNGLIAAWNGLMDILKPVTDALGKLFSALGNKGGEASGGIWEQLTGIFKQLWDIISKVAGVIGSALMPIFNAVAGLVSGALSAGFQTLFGVLSAVFHFIGDLINILTGLVDGSLTAGDALNLIWEMVGRLFNSVFTSIINGIGKFAIELVTKGVAAAQKFVLGLIAYIQTLPIRVWVWLVIMLAKINAWKNQMVALARLAGQQFINGVINFIRTLPAKAWAWFMNTLSKIEAFAGQAWSKAQEVGSNIIKAISDKLTSLPGDMYTWGVNAINSFIDAIINAIPGLRDALNAVSSLFPHSPPKEGPLATIKESNIYNWGKTVGGAIKQGVDEGATGIFDGVSTALPEIPTAAASSSVQAATTEVKTDDNAAATANTTQEMVSQSYNLIKDNVTNSLTTMANTDKKSWQGITNNTKQQLDKMRQNNNTSWNTMKNNTKTHLNNIRKSTSEVTTKMTGAWKSMATSIKSQADSIRTESTSDFGDLKSTISKFYTAISNPKSYFFGSPMAAGSRATPRAGFAGGSGRTLSSFADKIDPDVLGCLSKDCYFGGWDYSNPNISAVKDTVHGYKLGDPGFGLKVANFMNGNMPLYNNMEIFDYIAEKLIGGTHYDFYYNGRYSDSEALARGAFNCWDGAEILIDLANALGIGGSMVSGTWTDAGGTYGHVAAMIGGKIYDTTQRQNRGVWRGASGVSFGGPRPGKWGDNQSTEVSGEITFIHDFRNVPKQVTKEELLEAVKQSPDMERVVDRILIRNRRNTKRKFGA